MHFNVVAILESMLLPPSHTTPAALVVPADRTRPGQQRPGPWEPPDGAGLITALRSVRCRKRYVVPIIHQSTASGSPDSLIDEASVAPSLAERTSARTEEGALA